MQTDVVPIFIYSRAAPPSPATHPKSWGGSVWGGVNGVYPATEAHRGTTVLLAEGLTWDKRALCLFFFFFAAFSLSFVQVALFPLHLCLVLPFMSSLNPCQFQCAGALSLHVIEVVV